MNKREWIFIKVFSFILFMSVLSRFFSAESGVLIGFVTMISCLVTLLIVKTTKR